MSKSLESGKHPITGAFLKNKRLTENDIKQVTEEIVHISLKESAPAELIPGSSDKLPLPEGGEPNETTQQNLAPELESQEQPPKEQKQPDARIKCLLKILTPTHMQYLAGTVVAGEADDEIGALLQIMDNLCEK